MPILTGLTHSPHSTIPEAGMENAVADAEVWELELPTALHPGLPAGRAMSLCESARVCLHKHHTPPTRLGVEARERGGVGRESSEHVLAWAEPSQREHNANLNRRDAARDGAYAVALVCLERKLGLVAVGQARDLTGADWIVAPAGQGITEDGGPNLDDPTVRRVEVGGHGTKRPLPYELELKVRQLEAADSGTPGIAVVVGFVAARILMCTNVLSG
jgi:hypothetical protein